MIYSFRAQVTNTWSIVVGPMQGLQMHENGMHLEKWNNSISRTT